MVVNGKILIDAETFVKYFPVFDEDINANPDLIDTLYAGAGSWISLIAGELGLPIEVQTRGVYLASAHCLYMMKHPDQFRQVGSASEGSVSAGFNAPPTKDLFQYWLSLSPYGMELLAILSQVQPPHPDRPTSANPYYTAEWR